MIRAFWLLLAVCVVACDRVPRCATCGMRVNPASPWVAYLDVGGRDQPFDTPSCAFAAWKRQADRVKAARFREYYSQAWKPAEELRFISGSDVVGPMGPELVPVAEEQAARFARDHNGAPPKSAAEIVQENP